MKLKVTAVAYIAIVFAKSVCYLVTGYLVMLAEALHNVVDVMIFLTLMYSERVSEKPADGLHPLGHGLAKNLSGVVVSVVFITVVAFELFKEGVERIISPVEGRYPEIAIVVLVVTLIIPIILTLLYRGERTTTEESAFAELQNDIVSSFGAIVGVYLSSIGYHVADGLMAIFIALLICLNGYRIFKANASYLLGRSPSEEFYSKVKSIVESFPEVLDVHDMIAIYIGENRIHLDMHITVRGDMTVKEADELTTKIAREIIRRIPDVTYVLIHVCAEKGRFVKSTYDVAMRKVYEL
jgi:cation diffusion facilitator family transporter